jgi:uroporphyrin-3 C-methyltransferase
MRAITALELADAGLLEVGDPGLGNVRRAIASELQALRAVAQPDIEGIVLELGSLMARVPELPMRAAAPDNYVTDPVAGATDEPGLGRLWDRTRGAVTSIVRIEREDEPVALVLTESERRLAQRQLALELQIARAAVVDRRQTDFRASLVAADTLLNREFDREARGIVSARELLGGYMAVELAPPLPDISNSLSLLRNAPGAR